jgi:pilus assembly protein CpaB
MKVARLAVLAVALGAGVAAWSMARGLGTGESEPVVVEQAVDTDQVLVAARDIQPGELMTEDDLVWQSWPAGNVHASFIRRTHRPNAAADQAGSVARGHIFSGEPIRPANLVRAGSSGYMSAILPSGMRAVSTRTSPQTGAGGFILPNDRVDVILTRRESTNGGPADDYVSERVLSNVRVLAIDQTLEEQNGRTVVVGSVATLELMPEQTEILALAEQVGEISLALRSIMDGSEGEFGSVPVSSLLGGGRRAGSVNIVKYGVPSQVNAN